MATGSCCFPLFSTRPSTALRNTWRSPSKDPQVTRTHKPQIPCHVQNAGHWIFRHFVRKWPKCKPFFAIEHSVQPKFTQLVWLKTINHYCPWKVSAPSRIIGNRLSSPSVVRGQQHRKDQHGEVHPHRCEALQGWHSPVLAGAGASGASDVSEHVEVS